MAETANQSGGPTAGPTADVTAECSMAITLDSDLSQWQPNLDLDYVITIALVKSKS